MESAVFYDAWIFFTARRRCKLFVSVQTTARVLQKKFRGSKKDDTKRQKIEDIAAE